MANSSRDQNSVPTKTAVSNADGVTVLALRATPSTHALNISDGTTGTVVDKTNAPRDENSVPVMMAVSSADGVTPITLAIDSVTGKLLVKTT